MKKSLVLTILCLVFAVQAKAGNILNFNYGKDNSVLLFWGTYKTETYDVAIKVDDAYLAGRNIRSVSVPFNVANATDVKVWLSTELKLKTIENGKKVNDADIMTIDAVMEDGKLTAVLPEKYSLPANGVYVGYSFTLADNQNESAQPVSVFNETNSNGLYVHTSRSYRSWMSLSESLNMVSAMTVTFDGDFVDDAARLLLPKDFHAAWHSAKTLNATLVNKGKSDIKSIDYVYELNGKTFNGHYELPEPLPSKFNSSVPVSLPVGPFDFTGKYDMKVMVTKVNDKDNGSLVEGSVSVGLFEFIPVHRPVVENYMAVWGGYCPRAIAAVEIMKEKHPDFVSYSYHILDGMHIIAEEQLPNPTSEFLPTTWIERRYMTDVYSGSKGVKTEFAFDKDWALMVDSFAMADVKAEAVLKAGYGDCVDANATIKFVDVDKSKTYRVEFVLVADGLKGSGEDWEQLNYYSMMGDYESAPGMAKYVEMDEDIRDMVYDDIAIANSSFSPVASGSVLTIPNDVDNYIDYKTSFKFYLDECFCTYGPNSGKRLAQNKDKLSIVALLIENETGRVVNSHKVKVQTSTTGIAGVENDFNIEKTEYYNLSGVKIDKPSKGIVIRKNVKNGNVEVKTIMFP